MNDEKFTWRENHLIEIGEHYFFDAPALVDRLTNGLKTSAREVVFVVGAPLTASRGDITGVDDVGGVIKLIKDGFVTEQENLKRFEATYHSAGNTYQAAFRFLQGRRGQDAANAVIRTAVLGAHLGLRAERSTAALMTDAQLAELELNVGSWSLSPGVRSLGELASLEKAPFGKLVVTSNFDPLIEIAVRAAGGQSWRTALHTDGDFGQSKAKGCQVLHIHGYWQGSDTLHTGNQLLQSRPFLKNSLLRYLQDKLVVVVGYGGWQDIFTGALESLVSDASSFPEILWTFYDQAPEISPHLQSILKPGLDRNRVTLYGGIDCHTLFPELLTWWKGQAPASYPVSSQTRSDALPMRRKSAESDRPPSIEVWVGREAELRALETSPAKVAIICGIGGQGKSTLAARYLALVEDGSTPYTKWDWRDCKEQGDRIRTQLIASIERMSSEETEYPNLASASDADIVETFIRLAEHIRCVFVFDNVDSYVDLVNEEFSGILDSLTREFARAATNSKILITCRPRAGYDLISVVTIPLVGLSPKEASELFDERVGVNKVDKTEIATAHSLTEGHAFWLDMMAVQVGRAPGTTLKGFIDDIRRGRGGPTGLLNSIWKTLHEREKVVLRAMAETMRPETEDLIANVVSAKLNFKNFKRALRSLANLNMVLVKPERNSPDLFDLHPLVRQFVRMTFDRPERVGYIKIILLQYSNIIKGIGSSFGVHLPFSMLERWSQKAELEIEAGMLADALATLHNADNALIGSGHTEEFVRVARKLFQGANWLDLSALPHFDDVCSSLISCLCDLEEYDDADDILLQYEQTISAKTARYIMFCDTKAFAYWKRKKFPEAIDWAARGNDLKKASHVDTTFDCAHTLALAQRDGGDPEVALDYFLSEYQLENILNPNDDSIPDAQSLGNIGRCLHMMGRLEDALVCYRKSALLLETDGTASRLENQSFARRWIAEVFAATGKTDDAFYFFSDAEELVHRAFPGHARDLRESLAKLHISEEIKRVNKATVQRHVEKWIRGKPGPGR